jgi:flagellar biosynthetic protein FlhB
VSDDGDKTEEPSDHKLQEARRKGQVLKSQEIISTLGLLACAACLGASANLIFNSIADFTKMTWDRIPYGGLAEMQLLPELLRMLITCLISVAPLMAGAFLMGIISNVAQIQLLFTFETMKPSLSKINPIDGVKKIFSMKSIVELLKQLLKLAVIGYLSWKAVISDMPTFARSPGIPLDTTASFVWMLCKRAMYYAVGGMVVLSALDYAYQYKQFMKQMRMSHHDMKEEYKETEGNPHVKQKLRQKMMQAAQGGGGGAAEVPGASAVVTNPTHMAIAIRYKPGEDQIPIVVAKGENLIAAQIKVVAEDNDVPIIENVELARALFGACKIGQGVPTEMYKAVAEVLAYVMKLKRKKQMRRRRK